MSITRVQGVAANSPNSTSTSLTATLPAGATQGNLLVAAVACGNNAVSITPPDGSWTQVVINQPAGSNALIETSLWYLVVDAAHAGTASFTWTFSAQHSLFVCIEEWATPHGWPANPVDQSATGDNSGSPTQATTIKSGTTATTTQGEELWVASLAYKGSAQTEIGISAGWSSDLEATLSGANTMTMLYKVASATGAAACSYNIGTAQYWAGVIATFKDILLTTQARTTPATTALLATTTRTVAASAAMPVRSLAASAALSALGESRTIAPVTCAVSTPGLVRTVGATAAALSATSVRFAALSAALSGLPPITQVQNGALIRASDVNQLVTILQRPTGVSSKESGKYSLLGAASVSGGAMGAYVGTISRGSTPTAGITIDVGDVAPTNCAAPTTDSLSASGFRVTTSAMGPTPLMAVGGNYSITY